MNGSGIISTGGNITSKTNLLLWYGIIIPSMSKKALMLTFALTLLISLLPLFPVSAQTTDSQDEEKEITKLRSSYFTYLKCTQNMTNSCETEKKMFLANRTSLVEPSIPVPTALPTSQKPPSLNADLIFDLINNYRATIGLPGYQKDQLLCDLAKSRGPELYNEIFVTGNIHGGLYSRNLPYWITENMKYSENEQQAIDWWLSSYIHKKAIEGNFTYACGECYGKSCIMLFTSYIKK